MLRPLKLVHEYVVAYVLLTLLGLICLLFSIWALLMYPLLSRRAGTAAGRFGIMSGFRLFSWLLTTTGAYRLDLSAIDSLRDGPPVILAPNHPSLIDALLILTRHPNIA
jgi:1-acyl-sn-glycerol-3-phosphate acyltransferase